MNGPHIIKTSQGHVNLSALVRTKYVDDGEAKLLELQLRQTQFSSTVVVTGREAVALKTWLDNVALFDSERAGEE